jgi:hypothetical protein
MPDMFEMCVRQIRIGLKTTGWVRQFLLIKTAPETGVCPQGPEPGFLNRVLANRDMIAIQYRASRAGQQGFPAIANCKTNIVYFQSKFRQ